MPDTRKGWTSVPPSTRRLPWFRMLCARRRLDPDKHADRLDVIDDALRLAAESPVTGAEPLASTITALIVAAGQTVAGERGARQQLERAWEQYCRVLDEQ